MKFTKDAIRKRIEQEKYQKINELKGFVPLIEFIDDMMEQSIEEAIKHEKKGCIIGGLKFKSISGEMFVDSSLGRHFRVQRIIEDNKILESTVKAYIESITDLDVAIRSNGLGHDDYFTLSWA